MRKKWLLVGAIIVVGILAFAYLIPGSGIKDSEPQADITVFIEDLTTGDQASSLVTVGEPSGLSFVKPKAEFKPLETWRGQQQVKVYPTHKYSVWAQVTFRYTGTNIGSYSSAQAFFDANTGTTTNVMITQNQYNTMSGQYLTNDLCRLTVLQSSGLTSPMTLKMDSTQPWVYQARINDVGWKTSAPSTTSWDYLTGLHLSGTQINCKVIVRGTSNQGQPAYAEVSAQLTLMIEFLEEGGTISLSVDSMSAGVS